MTTKKDYLVLLTDGMANKQFLQEKDMQNLNNFLVLTDSGKTKLSEAFYPGNSYT